MDRGFEKAGFNFEARFGLFRNSVMQFADLAQFAIYRGATTNESLRTTVKYFVAGRTVFVTSKESTKLEQGVESKKTIKRPDALERKVDSLADQLAQLSLLVEKSQGVPVPTAVTSIRIETTHVLGVGSLVTRRHRAG